MNGTNDSGNEPARGSDPLEPPRPEIDPALLREVGAPLAPGEDAEAAPIGNSDGAGSAPWEIVSEMLESVPDAVEEANSAQDLIATEGPKSEEPPVQAPIEGEPEPERPAAIPVAAVAEEIAPPESSSDVSAPEDLPEEDEALVALRVIPLVQRIEALLFASSEPLSLLRLRGLAAAEDPIELRRTLDALADGYTTSGSALVLTEVGGGFVLRTRPELSPAVARLGKRRDQERLSNAALETLAIVAYRQPVLRADVEKIRGVASGEVLRSLTEKGLARVAGRADLPGNPLLYGTTQRFLELFGLRNLRDLPSDDQLLRRPATSN